MFNSMYLINIINTDNEPDIITQIIDGTYQNTSPISKIIKIKTMKTVKINTTLFRVSINAGNITEYTAQNCLVTQPNDAEFYDEEEADILVETYEAMYPNATVRKEIVEETMSINQLADEIASNYNDLGNKWNFQYNNQSRNYDTVADMCNELDSHDFTHEEIKPAIESDIDAVNHMNNVMTINEWCEFVADRVAQRVLGSPYDDVTFIFHVK